MRPQNLLALRIQAFQSLITSSIKKKLIFHPIVFALYPVISLFLYNAGQVQLRETIGTIIIVIIFSMCIWVVLNLKLRDWRKSAFLCSIFIILFFSYGHILNFLRIVVHQYEYLSWASFFITSQFGMYSWLILWVGIFITSYLLINRTHFNLSHITLFLNFVSLVIILLFSYNLIKIEKSRQHNQSKLISDWNNQIDNEFSSTTEGHSRNSPDIYYIILDGYGRSDILKEIYDYDNSEFLTFLKQEGFYVAEESRANYAFTTMSLTSSLNYMYLNNLAEKLGEASHDFMLVHAMAENNRLIRYLRGQGYLIRNVSTGYHLSEKIQADIEVSPHVNESAFQRQLINSTPIPILMDFPFSKNQFDIHRDRILFAFDNIVPNSDLRIQPEFTFVHIYAPHPPFVFGQNGEFLLPDGIFNTFDGDQYTAVMGKEEYVQGYQNQIPYITQRIQGVIQNIISNSQTQPIIVLQSDHGPGSMLHWSSPEQTNMRERMSILNAYYFPDRDYSDLYPSISPVNTFRIILNKYFQYDYDILRDESYYSSVGSPYFFYELTQDLDVVYEDD